MWLASVCPEVVLFVMLAGTPPFHSDDDIELMKKVKKAPQPRTFCGHKLHHKRDLILGEEVGVQAREGLATRLCFGQAAKVSGSLNLASSSAPSSKFFRLPGWCPAC